jgi:SNF2 family DNA or RNA helicase
MLLLDRGERLGTSFYHFRNSVQQAKQVGPMPNHVKWEDRPEALEAVFSLIKDVVIRHAFEDVMKHVPPNHVARYDFDLKPSTLKQYKALEESCILQLKDGSITAVHAAALRTKLLQLASGAVYTEEGKYSVIDTQRYELGSDLIEQHNHSVVFFNWRHQREQMAQMLTARGVSFEIIDGSVSDKHRVQIVKDFQAGRYQTVLLHPRTGAHGLTLTRGEACILLSPIYEADVLKQAIHRIYRGSQDKVTNTVLVQARGTVEDLVYERRLHKTLNMNDFLQLAVEAQARRR